MNIDESVARRFYAKVERNSNGCFEWTGATTTKGYGRIRVQGKLYGANRVSVVMHHGIDPGECDVCHTCDNPRCVRPSHLFVGSRSDNMRDCSMKGRIKFPVEPLALDSYGVDAVAASVKELGKRGTGRALKVSETTVRRYLKLHNISVNRV